MTNYQAFKALHFNQELFVLPNAWNAESARLLSKSEFKAIATSSAAVAAGLGYDDGEQMPFADYLFMVKRILSVITLPLTVDIEMGYGTTSKEIYSTISALADVGVVGINMEDSHFKPKRILQDADAFAKKLSGVKDELDKNHVAVFVNVRSDTYLLGVNDKEKETIKRAKLYESAGADGLFLPCIVADADIASAASSTKLPINVMCFPGLSDFKKLSALGVKRLSLGGFLFDAVYNQVKVLSEKVLQDKTINALVQK